MRRRDKAPSKSWGVKVCPADRYSASSYYTDNDYRTTPVQGQMAVKITYGGKPKVSFGVVAILDANFDTKIAEMCGEAEERAAALNAVGAEG